MHVVVSKECWDQMHPAIKKLNLNQLFFHDKIDFEDAFPGLVEVLRRQADYVEQHTRILTAALNWQRNHKQTRYLLIGEERKQAVAWLEKRFADEQPPCAPTDLQCEFLCESTRNANNLMTQVFISYTLDDKAFMVKLRQTLMRHHITVWMDRTDKTDYQTSVTSI